MSETGQHIEDWWDIFVNEKLLVTVNGKVWAEKYMVALKRGSKSKWHMRPKEVSDALDFLRIARPEDSKRSRR